MKNNLDSLISLMQDKINTLLKINELTLQQQSHILDNDFDKLIVNLDSRQELIVILKDINDLIKSKYKAVEECFDNSIGEYIDEVSNFNSLKTNANIILSRIVETDQRNEPALKDKMEELKKNIRLTNNNKKGFTVYNNMNYNIDSLYFDKNK